MFSFGYGFFWDQAEDPKEPTTPRIDKDGTGSVQIKGVGAGMSPEAVPNGFRLTSIPPILYLEGRVGSLKWSHSPQSLPSITEEEPYAASGSV